MSITEALITAEEFRLMSDFGQPTELVRGKVVMMNMPGARHGQVCGNIVFGLKAFLATHDLGHALCNDAGIVTERSPDTVRGSDVTFYSYARLPKGEVPEGYPSVAPEIVFEVLSPTDRWKEVLRKVAEYLNAGVLYVCVVDPKQLSVMRYNHDRPEDRLTGSQSLEFADVLPGFSLSVENIFAG